MVQNRYHYLFLAFMVLSGGLVIPITSFTTNLEDLSASVAYLQENNESIFKIGTGFFVTSKNQYLVTASHVAKFISPKSFLTMRNPGDVPVSLSFKELFPGKTVLPWHFHSEADVAVLVLPLNDKTIQFFQGRFLALDMLKAEEAAPQRERPLVVMGFPLALGTKGRFSPLTVEAKAASGLLRMNRFDTDTEATFFVLDKPSIGGYSGAPVYLMPWPYSDGPGLTFPEVGSPEANPKCVGLVHGTKGDNTGGKLAVIVPSIYIVNTIKKVEEVGVPPN